MSDAISRKKKHKKKSFLYKVSRAFGGRKRSKGRENCSSSESDEDYASTSDNQNSNSNSNSNSRGSTPRESPSKIKDSVLPTAVCPNIQTNFKDTTGLHADSQHFDVSAGESLAHDQKVKQRVATPHESHHLRLSSTPAGGAGEVGKTGGGEDTPTHELSATADRNLKSKRAFLENFPKSNTGEQVLEMISGQAKMQNNAADKLINKERKNIDEVEVISDSDESDTTESIAASDDESLTSEHNEHNNYYGADEVHLKARYFTTGKFISYFFLEMERQNYNPQAEKYSYIRYRSTSRERTVKGEQSSSGSASPNITSHMKHNLLHRRSVDNIPINSASTWLEHSSPESVKSVPIKLKSRSTSHDAIARKRDRHANHETTGTAGAAASMDSLAKQALLAAQVLNLIPTQKARERNFLHGRIAATSLLGPVELEKVLPNREIKIFVGTWNMNGQTPPKELNDFMLPSDIQSIPDVLAIGTQESCSERSEWEAAIQETLGPSHVLLTSTALGTLHLALFLRRDLVWFCSIPEDDNFSTRPGTAFRTKGAVALALIIFGTSFLFVTAHLTAHQDKVKERIHDIKRIIRNLDLPKELPTKHNKSKDVTQNFDCVFWCGDLNFRLAQPREEVIQWVSETTFPQASPIDLGKDQLRMSLNEGAILRGFEEAPITFPPTYKYDPGSQTFDSSSKQRTPAYTDRILFKGKGYGNGNGNRGYIRRISHESTNSHKDGNIECLVYDSVPSICTSDHKPVWGVFKTTVRPGIDTIPLAAGLFNREIYLEGIKRRATAMDDSYSSSKVCSLQ